jgi:hypothetical protein
MEQHQQADDVQHFIQNLRSQNVFSHQDIENRWNELSDSIGHVHPCKKTGNQFTQQLCGHDLIQLALYQLTYPKAKVAEINTLLYNANFGDPKLQFYSPSQITNAEKRLAYQKMWKHNCLPSIPSTEYPEEV